MDEPDSTRVPGNEFAQKSFLNWLAHELRNPIAAISGAAQILQSGVAAGDHAVELHEIVLRQVQKLQQIVDELPQLAARHAQLADRQAEGDERTSVRVDPAPPSAALPAHSPRLKVLVIDDQRDVRLPAEHLLRHAGFDVFTAATGEDGLTLLESQCPDVLLCDLGLPGMGGLDVVKQLQHRSTTRVVHQLRIAVTGADRETDRQLALAAGYDELLVKPLDFPMLIDRLRRFAQQRFSNPSLGTDA